MNPLVEQLRALEAPANELDNFLFVNDFDFWIDFGLLVDPVRWDG